MDFSAFSKKARWSPEYRLRDDLVCISDVEIQQCPVSYITPDSIEVIQQYFRARQVHDAFGVSMFGPDLSEWPTWAVYAVAALEQESIKVRNAMTEASN